MLDGRFGPYVTDGTVNASVPRGTDPEWSRSSKAVELLRERAARAPATKKKAPAKKSTAKKATPPKKTTPPEAKKAPAKKAAAEDHQEGDATADPPRT